MRYMLVFLSFICIFFTGCNKKSTNEACIPDWLPTPSDDEDALIFRLSSDLIAEPKNQAEKDQNAIVNYAIDKLLDVKATRTGLYYQILAEGSGKQIAWGDWISVHYRGYFLNGREFDSSYKKKKPLEFYVGNMIDGWNEGLQLLKKGGKALFIVPSTLAYGEEGLKLPNGKVIVPPDSVLVFELEVLEK